MRIPDEDEEPCEEYTLYGMERENLDGNKPCPLSLLWDLSDMLIVKDSSLEWPGSL